MDDLVRYQRVDDVQREDRNACRAERVGEAKRLQRQDQVVVQAALHDDTELALVAGKHLVQLVLGDELPRRRQPYFRLELLLPESRGWMREPVVDELLGRAVELQACRDRGGLVPLRRERTL